MTTKTRCKSELLESVHNTAKALLKVGAITPATMRQFDGSCLSIPKHYSPADIKALRERFNVSQPVFARYLNTTESTVQKWESGNPPGGVTLKMLSVIDKHGLEILF